MGNGEDVAEDGEEEDAEPVDVLEVADKVELEEDVLVGAELEDEQVRQTRSRRTTAWPRNLGWHARQILLKLQLIIIKTEINKGPLYNARLDPFGDHGQIFCPIFTKTGTACAFMCTGW